MLKTEATNIIILLLREAGGRRSNHERCISLSKGVDIDIFKG